MPRRETDAMPWRLYRQEGRSAGVIGLAQKRRLRRIGDSIAGFRLLGREVSAHVYLEADAALSDTAEHGVLIVSGFP